MGGRSTPATSDTRRKTQVRVPHALPPSTLSFKPSLTPTPPHTTPPHTTAVEGRHLQADFDKPAPKVRSTNRESSRQLRGFEESFKARFAGNMLFRTVIFDYFYIPAHWSSERWGRGRFVKEVIPWLHHNCDVQEFWLPNCKAMHDLLVEHTATLEDEGLQWYGVADPTCNPLYSATNEVENILLESLYGPKTNENQRKQYLDKDHPFILVIPIPWPKRRRMLLAAQNLNAGNKGRPAKVQKQL